MPLAGIAEIVEEARSRGRGVAAFNVVSIEHAQAIVAGAEAAERPAVLQLSENTVRYHGGAIEPIGAATLAVADDASVPVSVHLDHATSLELVRRAVRAGFGSVMFDASRREYAANVATSAEAVAWCHERGIWVETELGEVGGKDGAHDPRARTDPGQAADYVAATGVDALAVAVGSSHAMREQAAALDLELVGRLRAAVGVPLVLHGSSGVPDTELGAAVRRGMTKINIATRLNQAFTTAVRRTLAARPEEVDPRNYLGPARDAVAGEVARLLRLIG